MMQTLTCLLSLPLAALFQLSLCHFKLEQPMNGNLNEAPDDINYATSNSITYACHQTASEVIFKIGLHDYGEFRHRSLHIFAKKGVTKLQKSWPRGETEEEHRVPDGRWYSDQFIVTHKPKKQYRLFLEEWEGETAQQGAVLSRC